MISTKSKNKPKRSHFPTLKVPLKSTLSIVTLKFQISSNRWCRSTGIRKISMIKEMKRFNRLSEIGTCSIKCNTKIERKFMRRSLLEIGTALENMLPFMSIQKMDLLLSQTYIPSTPANSILIILWHNFLSQWLLRAPHLFKLPSLPFIMLTLH